MNTSKLYDYKINIVTRWEDVKAYESLKNIIFARS